MLRQDTTKPSDRSRGFQEVYFLLWRTVSTSFIRRPFSLQILLAVLAMVAVSYAVAAPQYYVAPGLGYYGYPYHSAYYGYPYYYYGR